MLVLQERDANNLPTVTYTRGIDLSGGLQWAGGIGGLLARTDFQGTFFYHGDAGGNITALIDSYQNVVAHYRYDPFGNLLGLSGSMADANLYRFSSKEWHANSGLYYYGFRFYEPATQRWLNRDPTEESGGLNLYAFGQNNPVVCVDPLGQTWWDGIRDGLIALGLGVVGGAVVVATFPEALAVLAAILAAGAGGYLTGNNAYEFITKEEAFTQRPLTQDEWETHGGHVIVDAASLGVARCRWFNRGANKDCDWLKKVPSERWPADRGLLTVSRNKWGRVQDIPPGRRGLTIVDIYPPAYALTWPEGASPGLRFAWPFAFAPNNSGLGSSVHNVWYQVWWDAP
jgi:RHS repeat-associated protein